MPAASSPTTPRASRCTTAPRSSATATSTARSSRSPARRGSYVLARMDSNRVARGLLSRRTPTGSAVDIDGEPYRAGRQVRHLHQLALLQRVPARGDARDHRAQPPRRLHRQQLAGPAAHQHLLLRPLQGAVPATTPAWRCRPRTTGTIEAYRHWIRWNYPAPHRALGAQQRGHHAKPAAPIASGSGMIGGELLYNSDRFIDLQGDPAAQPRSSCSTTSAATASTASSRTPRPASGCTRSPAGTS